MQHVSLAIVGKTAITLILGLLVGMFGTVMHRSMQPWGVVLALVLVLSTALLVRAWGAFLGLIAYGLGVVVSVQVLAQSGPGGDTLVPAHQAISWVWVAGSVVMVIVAALAPRLLFADPPSPEALPSADPTISEPGWPALDEPGL